MLQPYSCSQAVLLLLLLLLMERMLCPMVDTQQQCPSTVRQDTVCTQRQQGIAVAKHTRHSNNSKGLLQCVKGALATQHILCGAPHQRHEVCGRSQLAQQQKPALPQQNHSGVPHTDLRYACNMPPIVSLFAL